MSSIVSCSRSTDSALARAADVRDLGQDVDAVTREVVRQAVHLPREPPAGETEHGEHEDGDGEHRRDTTDTALEPGDGRGEDEGEKDGKGDRHQHRLGPVQHHDDEHAAGERHPRLQGLLRVIHGLQDADP